MDLYSGMVQQTIQLDENNQFLLSLWNSLRIGIGSALLSSLCGLGLVSFIAYGKAGREVSWKF